MSKIALGLVFAVGSCCVASIGLSTLRLIVHDAGYNKPDTPCKPLYIDKYLEPVITTRLFCEVTG
jgi:hypothetical protein